MMYRITRLIDLINDNGHGDNVSFECDTEDLEKVRKEMIKERHALNKNVTDVIFIYKILKQAPVDTVQVG